MATYLSSPHVAAAELRLPDPHAAVSDTWQCSRRICPFQSPDPHVPVAKSACCRCRIHAFHRRRIHAFQLPHPRLQLRDRVFRSLSPFGIPCLLPCKNWAVSVQTRFCSAGVLFLRISLECTTSWRTPDDGMFNVDARKYQLSKSASRLDHFLSHDWASSRWLKLMSLLVLHNSGPAFCTSLATSLLVGILVACQLLPYSLWTPLFGHFSFFFVLCFWQRIRASFGRPLMVFLDVLCIAQHDEKHLG